MRTLALIVLLSCAMAASAGLYSWTDADGHKHFGDKPPAGSQTGTRQIPEKKAYAPGTDTRVKEIYQRTNRMFDASEQVKKEAGEKKDAAKSGDEARRKACDDARDQARKLSGRVVYVDDDGKEVRSPDSDRVQHLKETQEWIAANCN